MGPFLDWILRLLPLVRLLPAAPLRAFKPHREDGSHPAFARRHTAARNGHATRSARHASLLTRIPVELRCLAIYRNLNSVRPFSILPAQGVASARGATCPAAPGNHRIQSLLRLARANRLIPLLDRSGAVRWPVCPASLR